MRRRRRPSKAAGSGRCFEAVSDDKARNVTVFYEMMEECWPADFPIFFVDVRDDLGKFVAVCQDSWVSLNIKSPNPDEEKPALPRDEHPVISSLVMHDQSAHRAQKRDCI